MVRSVYIGPNLSSLTLVATLAGSEDLSFSAAAGTHYYLALDLQDPRVVLVGQTADSSLQLEIIRQPHLRVSSTTDASVMDLVITGGSAAPLVLQQSDDLLNWDPVEVIHSPAADYRLPQPRSQLRNFYRIVPEW